MLGVNLWGLHTSNWNMFVEFWIKTIYHILESYLWKPYSLAPFWSFSSRNFTFIKSWRQVPFLSLMATNIKCNHVSFFPFLYPKNSSSSDCDLEWLLLIRTYIHMHSNYDLLQEKHGSFPRIYLNFKHGLNLTAWIFRKQQEWLYHFLVMYVQADFSQYNWTDFRKQKVMPYKTIFSFNFCKRIILFQSYFTIEFLCLICCLQISLIVLVDKFYLA